MSGMFDHLETLVVEQE